ncbi:MAG TPA: helix-turn-helix transcriptional regulator [Methanocorpusculum sp.]|nr:helix-turn-helix transcriptional regulator [Methanocorpusculum sp.]
MTQGERVKEIRKYLNLTMEKFGERLGVGKTAISKLENNERNLTDQMAISICREFNVSETWLRTGEGEMFKPKPPEDEVGYYVEELLENEDNPLYRVIIEMMKTYHGLDDKSKEVIRNYFAEIENAIKEKKEN